MNHELDDLKDTKAIRREQKKKPKMKKHGQSLKKPSDRTALHQLKAEKKRK